MIFSGTLYVHGLLPDLILIQTPSDIEFDKCNEYLGAVWGQFRRPGKGEAGRG